MKSWQINDWCEPEQMTLADAPVPEPGPSQIRIRNRAAALNFFDLLQIQGKYQSRPAFPFTPGAEVSGTVDAIGEGVTDVAVGDAVWRFPWAADTPNTALQKASGHSRSPRA